MNEFFSNCNSPYSWRERERMSIALYSARWRERERFFPILIHLTGEEREFENFFFFCVLLDEKERERERIFFFLF